MRMKNWMKYLSMLMSLVLLMTMAPSATAFAAEDGAGKIVLTSFEKLESCRTNCTFNRKERRGNRALFCIYPKIFWDSRFLLTLPKSTGNMQARII